MRDVGATTTTDRGCISSAWNFHTPSAPRANRGKRCQGHVRGPSGRTAMTRVDAGQSTVSPGSRPRSVGPAKTADDQAFRLVIWVVGTGVDPVTSSPLRSRQGMRA